MHVYVNECPIIYLIVDKYLNRYSSEARPRLFTFDMPRKSIQMFPNRSVSWVPTVRALINMCVCAVQDEFNTDRSLTVLTLINQHIKNM